MDSFVSTLPVFFSLFISFGISLVTLLVLLVKKKDTPFVPFLILTCISLVCTQVALGFLSFEHYFYWDFSLKCKLVAVSYLLFAWYVVNLILLCRISQPFACPFCKKKISRSSAFCPKCGANVHPEPTAIYSQSSLIDKTK